MDEQFAIDRKRKIRTPFALSVLAGVLALIVTVAIVVIVTTPNAQSPTFAPRTLKFCETETRGLLLGPKNGTRTMDYAVFNNRLNAQQRSDFEASELLTNLSFCFSSLVNGNSHGSATLQVDGSSVQSREYGSAISLYLRNSGDFSHVTTGNSK